LALLPTVLLLVLGVVVWLVRNRPERVVWAVSVAGQWLVWLTLLGIHRYVPTEIGISVWRPVALFQTPLVLSLDTTGWTMAFAIATLLLAIGMTSAARSGSATPATRVFLSVYGALGMAAVTAGNLLTMGMAWAMMEVVAFTTSLVLVGRRDIIPREILRLAMQGTSVILLLAAAVLLGSNGVPGVRGMSAWGYALGLAAAVLRWGLFPAHYPLPSLPGIRRGLGTCLRLLPAGMGMVLIVRLLQGDPPLIFLTVLAWFGGVLALVSGITWAFHTDPVRRRPMLVLGLAGLTLCAVGASPASPSEVVALGGSAALVLIGGMVSLAEPHEMWHRWWVLPAVFMLIGGPFSPAQRVLEPLVGSAHAGSAVPGGLGLVGGVLLAVGIVRHVEVAASPWPSGESLVKASYAVGIALIPLAAVEISLAIPTKPSALSVALFLAMAGASALAYYGYVRAGERTRASFERVFGSARLPEPWPDMGSFLASPLNGLVWIGDLFQGDAGLLWILFFLLMLVAIVGRGA